MNIAISSSSHSHRVNSFLNHDVYHFYVDSNSRTSNVGVGLASKCLSSALLERPQFGLASKVSVRPFLIRWRGFVNCVDTSDWFVRRRQRQVIVTPMFGFPDTDGRGQDVVRRRHGDRNPGVDFGVACACREDLPDWRTVKKVSDALLVARLRTDMKNSLS